MFAWEAQGERHGICLKARFFDGDVADRIEDRVERTLCFLQGTTARLLWREQDRRNLRWGSVVAQSDGVYALGDGLLNLEYKSRGKRPIECQNWGGEVRLKDILQCLTIVVAQNLSKPCAAVLSYHNAGILLVPQQALLDTVITWSRRPAPTTAAPMSRPRPLQRSFVEAIRFLNRDEPVAQVPLDLAFSP